MCMGEEKGGREGGREREREGRGRDGEGGREREGGREGGAGGGREGGREREGENNETHRSTLFKCAKLQFYMNVHVHVVPGNSPNFPHYTICKICLEAKFFREIFFLVSPMSFFECVHPIFPGRDGQTKCSSSQLPDRNFRKSDRRSNVCVCTCT